MLPRPVATLSDRRARLRLRAPGPSEPGFAGLRVPNIPYRGLCLELCGGCWRIPTAALSGVACETQSMTKEDETADGAWLNPRLLSCPRCDAQLFAVDHSP